MNDAWIIIGILLICYILLSGIAYNIGRRNEVSEDQPYLQNATFALIIFLLFGLIAYVTHSYVRYLSFACGLLVALYIPFGIAQHQKQHKNK